MVTAGSGLVSAMGGAECRGNEAGKQSSGEFPEAFVARLLRSASSLRQAESPPIPKGGIHVQEVTSRNYVENEEPSLMTQVGQAAMVFTGAALVALAAKERSWRTLGIAAASAPLLYRGTTGRWPVPRKIAQSASDAVAPVPIETAVTIGKPADELYRFWRQLENLPRFMKNLESVTELGGRRSHWVGKSPLGFKLEWDAEILEEREGKLLSWRSLPGSDVQNAGTVFFDAATGGRGTVVRA